jgi:hypothetical protein
MGAEEAVSAQNIDGGLGKIGTALRGPRLALVPIGALVGLLVAFLFAPTTPPTLTFQLAVVDQSSDAVAFGLQPEMGTNTTGIAAEANLMSVRTVGNVSFAATAEPSGRLITLVATGPDPAALSGAVETVIAQRSAEMQDARQQRIRSSLQRIDATLSAIASDRAAAGAVEVVGKLRQERVGLEAYAAALAQLPELVVLQRGSPVHGGTGMLVPLGGAVAGAAIAGFGLVLAAMTGTRIRQRSDVERIVGTGAVLAVIPTDGNDRALGLGDLAAITRVRLRETVAFAGSTSDPSANVALVACAGEVPSELVEDLEAALGDGASVAAIGRTSIGLVQPTQLCIVVVSTGVTTEEDLESTIRTLSNLANVAGIILYDVPPGHLKHARR